MAFDPIQEDCHRLVLEALRRDNIPLTDGAAVERLMEQFTRNPAPLIVHDRDRAGHLIAKVVEAVDYRIPFIPDDAQAEQEEAAAENMLREAAALDPSNWDAQRMLTALTAESNEEYVQYLVSKCDEVEHDLALKIASAQDPYEREAAGDLTRRPYLRWLAALASRALISGRYRMSLDAANRSLDFAPNDPAGVRHTAMLAMAKLEYPAEELKRFRSAHSVPYLANTPLRRRPKDAERDLDPWTLIALMSAAWRELDYEGAEHYLRILVRSCPHAAEALYFQTEFPDGVYARVNVGPGSTDELVLALSEATPVLQEGLGAPDNASFAAWVATNDIVRSQIDERILRAAEQGLPFKGGDLYWIRASTSPPTWSAPTLRRTPNSPMQHASLSITTSAQTLTSMRRPSMPKRCCPIPAFIVIYLTSFAASRTWAATRSLSRRATACSTTCAMSCSRLFASMRWPSMLSCSPSSWRTRPSMPAWAT